MDFQFFEIQFFEKTIKKQWKTMKNNEKPRNMPSDPSDAFRKYVAPYGDSGRFDVTGWSGNILRIELDPVLPSFCLTE